MKKNILKIKSKENKTVNMDKTRLKILSYNIQVGIQTKTHMDYVFNSWKHFLPHKQRQDNLAEVARFISAYDIVGLQELDAGSFRSNFINYAEYLAGISGHDFWYDQTNRKIANLARHSLGILSRYPSISIERHSLPSMLPGRSALVVRFGDSKEKLALIIAHLSLGKNARMKQAEYLSELVRNNKHSILMGDLNCKPDSEEINLIVESTGMKLSAASLPTYPSWNPEKKLDYIFVTPEIKINSAKVVKCCFSDHLPVAMDITVPFNIGFTDYENMRKAA